MNGWKRTKTWFGRRGWRLERKRIVLETVSPVVRIYGEGSVGSGFFVEAEDGSLYVMSVLHNFAKDVVHDGEIKRIYPREGFRDFQIEVFDYQFGEVRNFIRGARMLWFDKELDFALLKLVDRTYELREGLVRSRSGPGFEKGDVIRSRPLTKNEIRENQRFIPAKLSPEWVFRGIGDKVVATGCGKGGFPGRTSGEITWLDLAENRMRINATIASGNSGGPIFDEHTHEVIGIVFRARLGSLFETDSRTGEQFTSFKFYEIVGHLAWGIPIDSVYESIRKFGFEPADEGKIRWTRDVSPEKHAKKVWQNRVGNPNPDNSLME